MSDHHVVLLGNYVTGLVYRADATKAGVLMVRDVGTLFRSRRAAKQAILRTLTYAQKRNFTWGPYRLVRVVNQEQEEQKR